MKTRNGFVSNSSSTSFTFCFKGGKIETLYSLIEKYKDNFELSYPFDFGTNYSDITAKDVIDSIKALPNGRMGIRVRKIADILDEATRDYAYAIENYKKQKHTEDRYYRNRVTRCKTTVEKINTMIQKGFDTAIVIGFGDNDGEISGGAVGNIMDYAGRDISITEKDFIVWTEQNR